MWSRLFLDVVLRTLRPVPSNPRPRELSPGNRRHLLRRPWLKDFGAAQSGQTRVSEEILNASRWDVYLKQKTETVEGAEVIDLARY